MPPFPSAWDDSDESFGLLGQRLRLERGPMTFIEGEERRIADFVVLEGLQGMTLLPIDLWDIFIAP